MTSEEIRNTTNLLLWEWLREIAYQLAVGNEQRAIEIDPQNYYSLAGSVPAGSGIPERGSQPVAASADPARTAKQFEAPVAHFLLCPEGRHNFTPPFIGPCVFCGWTSAEIAAVQPDRCPVCDWPFAPSRDQGCVPGDCSYRPSENSKEWRRIQERKRQLAASTEPSPGPPHSAGSEAVGETSAQKAENERIWKLVQEGH